MITVDFSDRLQAEFYGAFERAWDQRAKLERWMLANRVPADLCVWDHMRFTIARVQTFDGTFEFNPDAGDKVCVIVPDGVQFPTLMGWHLIDDIIAFDHTNPLRWWRRLGAADVLGSAVLEDARSAGEPVKLYRDPLSWMRAGGDGCAIVARDRDPRHIFHGIPEILCEDAALADWLKRKIAHFEALDRPRIGVVKADPAQVAA